MGVFVELLSVDERISRLPFSVGELDGCLSANTGMLIVQSHHHLTMLMTYTTRMRRKGPCQRPSSEVRNKAHYLQIMPIDDFNIFACSLLY
jgi:hypothetical protein